MVSTVSHYYAMNWDESTMEYDTPRVDYYMCDSARNQQQYEVEHQRDLRHNNYKTTAINR